MESKVKDGNYVVIQSFMVNRLNLKGNELIIYALIYGFSQDGEQHFTGSLKYLSDWTNSSKQGISKSLKSLVKKGLIEKEENFINGVKFCEYYATKFNGGMQQSLMGGMQQSLPNNLSIYNIDDILDKYHSTLTDLPKVIKLTDRRKSNVKARIDEYGYDNVFKIFDIVANSDFLLGKVTEWKADFDWIMLPNNFVKVLEGKYLNADFNLNKSEEIENKELKTEEEDY